MTMPVWWSERRFGLFVHATTATVPGWAPIGEYAEWYRSHLGDDVADVLLHPRPMVEVLAHHRDRWGHVERYDDFVPLLAFDRFDAEAWAELAAASGARYSVLVTKHHDGWTWWDAPGTTRRLTEQGPCRNVLADYAAACERRDIALGTYYSLLDWGDERYPDAAYVDEVLHPQVVDLVERYGSVMLWGDGHWGHDAGVWRTADLLRRVREVDPEIVVNDRWWASSAEAPDDAPAIVRTFEYDAPDDIVDGPWELTRGLAHSFGYNRAERAEHHMTGFDIVALYTEVLAKGGHLLLNVGPDADGTIPELQAGPLRDAGTWIRRFDAVLTASTPWDRWGDDDVRYVRHGDDLLVIDIGGRGHFAELAFDAIRVTGVELVDDRGDHDVAWVQNADGLAVSSRPRAGDFETDRIGIPVYRVGVEHVERPDKLFAPHDPAPIALAPLLADARPGDIVQLGDGRYVGPASVPVGVVLRGLGAGRTTIEPGAGDSTIVPESAVVEVGSNARVEHVRVSGRSSRSDWFAPPLVDISADGATLLGCTIDGRVSVTGDDVLVRAVTAQGVIATAADRLHVSRCHFSGNRWDVGVELRGGGGQNVESTELDGHLCAVRLTDTTGATVRGNTIVARWWGVHVDHSEGSHIHGNRVNSTMRAVDVDGGTEAVVDGNAVTDGDSGCIVEDGASRCEVYGNHWDRCRIGLLAWGAVSLHHQDNTASGLHEPDSALVTGP